MHNTYNIYLTINQETKEKEFKLNSPTTTPYSNYNYEKIGLTDKQKIAWGVSATKGAEVLSFAILQTLYDEDFALEYYKLFSNYLKNINHSDEANFSSYDVDKWLKENIPNIQTVSLTFPNQITKTFETHNELREWLDNIQNEYSEILSSNRNVKNIIQSKFNEIDNNFINIEDRNTHSDNSYLHTLGETFSKLLADINFIELDNDKFIEVQKVYEKEPKVACFMLVYFLGLTSSINETIDNDILKGFFIGLQYDNGIKSNIENEKNQLNSLKEDYSSNQNELIKTLKTYTKEVQNNDTTLKNKIEDFESQFSGFISSSKKDYEDVKKFYDTELQLKAPAKYWRIRERNHLKKSIYFGIGLAGVGLSLAIFLLVMVNINEYVTWSNSATTIIVATGGIWLLKMLNKLFMSNYHLYVNAQERFTMINTYLSMIRKSNLDNEKDKQYILDALFKHSSDGIINDTDFSLPINDLIKALKK